MTSHWWDFGDYRIIIVDQTIPVEIRSVPHIKWISKHEWHDSWIQDGMKYQYLFDDEIIVSESNPKLFIDQLKLRPELLVTLKGNRQMKIIDNTKTINLENLKVGDVVVTYDDDDDCKNYFLIIVENDAQVGLLDLDTSTTYRRFDDLEDLADYLDDFADNVKIVNAELKLTNYE